jgi:hypothetical protein
VDEKDNEFVWTIHRCPICWTRKGADKPVCYISTGLLQAMLNTAPDLVYFKDKEHLFRMAGLFVVGILLFFVARALLVPAD